MLRRFLCILAMLSVCRAVLAAPGELVMIAPTDLTMPLLQFRDGQLSGGILKDLGDALAQRLGRRAIYLNVDVDGVTPTLTEGRADGICYVLPHWIDGDYLWSRPLIPDAELVVARDGAPPIRSLADLRDRPIGTVTGYRYPRVEQVLGKQFFRTESPNMDKNLRRLMAGEVQYTILVQSTMAYLTRNDKTLRLRPDLVFSTFKAQCAFSRKSRIPFQDISRAIDALVDDGSVERILARYR
ncbi:MAG TPA: transporter substrate-binding domain-containing protein [Burkholderiaceae bacterium]|nr:transporter substrate-binding domain-containing protein [Burkholderiaceae bacterium]